MSHPHTAFIARLLSCSVIILALSGCGQKGALYYPEHPESESEPSLSQNDGLTDRQVTTE
ncbi:MAG: lipoprotein [Pseudomonadota bacterium]|nr:lipoprotein [Pseudomonadota bacterium]